MTMSLLRVQGRDPGMGRVLGLDIGGANLKAATVPSGAVRSEAFDLWRAPAELAGRLGRLAADLLAGRPAPVWAVTMTAELCDCFATKREGVEAVLDAVAEAARSVHSRQVAGLPPTGRDRPGPEVRVWLTDGTFTDIAGARAAWESAAASNWSALATVVAATMPEGDGLLLDIGSTTADIVPMRGGRHVALGRTDATRLRHGELLYTGVVRTPVCAVCPTLPWRGADVPVAAELFATMRDVWMLAGDLPEDPADTRTADGRPATKAMAAARLARMLCLDGGQLGPGELDAMVAAAADRQVASLVAAMRLCLRQEDADPPAPTRVVLSGSGEFLGRRVVGRAVREGVLPAGAEATSLSTLWGPDRSNVAPAHAVAVLAADRRPSACGNSANGDVGTAS